VEINEVDALRAAIVRECAVEFGALGWESTGTDMLPHFSRPGSTEIVYELGVGCRVMRVGSLGAVAVVRGISLGATAGVRHVVVSDLLGQLTGEPPAGKVVESRERLMPMFYYALRDAPRDPVPHDWRDTWITTPGEAASVVATLRADLLAHGMPFLCGYTTLADVIGYLEQQTKRGPHQRRALAIAQALSGRIDDALATLAQFVDWDAATAHQTGAPEADTPYYRPFFVGFVAHFNVEAARLPPQVARVL